MGIASTSAFNPIQHLRVHENSQMLTLAFDEARPFGPTIWPFQRATQRVRTRQRIRLLPAARQLSRGRQQTDTKEGGHAHMLHWWTLYNSLNGAGEDHHFTDPRGVRWSVVCDKNSHGTSLLRGIPPRTTRHHHLTTVAHGSDSRRKPVIRATSHRLRVDAINQKTATVCTTFLPSVSCVHPSVLETRSTLDAAAKRGQRYHTLALHTCILSKVEAGPPLHEPTTSNPNPCVSYKNA